MEALSGRINPFSEREINAFHLPKDKTRLDFCFNDNRVVGYAQLQNIKGCEWAVVPEQALILGKAPGLGRADDVLEPNHHQEAERGLPKVLRVLTEAECGSAFVYWQQEKGLLWLGGDRYGLKPFYYYHHMDELAFSTDLQWLVQTSNRKFSVNYSVLSQFLCLRHPFGDETLFAGIRRLPQGALLCYSVQEGKLQFVPFFTYLSLRPDPGVTFKQVLAETPGRFTAALERQLNGASKVVLPLSGGYDSRMIACGLHRLGVELLTYTTHKDYGSTTDSVAAAAVAALLGVTHHNIPLPISYFARFHQQKCRLVQFETSYHPWIVNLLSSMPEEPIPCFDGLGGNACLGGTEATPRFWELWRKKQYKPFENSYFQWYKTGFESLIRSKYHREIIALARKEVVAEINRVKGNPNGLIYLGLRNFTRRAISLSTFGILGHNRPVRTPFLDHEFFEWSMTIPVRLKVKVNVYRHLFQKYTKETSAIPTTNQRPDGSRYFQKIPQRWRKYPNRVYLVKMMKQLSSFLPKFVAPDLIDRLKTGMVHGAHRDALFALADLAYWFVTYQDQLKIKGWLK